METLVTATALRATIVGILTAFGVPDRDATCAADVLVEADLTGVDSHGCHLVPMYARRLRAGHIAAAAAIEVLDDSGSTVWLDAGLGIGQLAGVRATDLVIERARAHGVAAVCVREATHLGALGVYTRRAAEAGVICFCFQNGPTVVPPFGGITPLFSTNPISYAVPAGRHPAIVYDIATTAVAGNRLLLAKKRGDAHIPEGWACDEAGRPTTDPQAASVWHLQWFGGHKGYGLGLLVEILAGVLAGSSFGRTEHTASPVHGRERVAKGCTFIGLDPVRFVGPGFVDRIDALIDDIHASTPAEGVERLLVPGELEAERRQRRLREGIPLARELVTELDELAVAVGAPTLVTR